MIFGEIVIGPPGSGKTSYILKKRQILKRKCMTINLDPGNENNSFDYDIRQFYKTEDYITKNEYGPNNAVKEILKDFAQNLDEHLSFLEDEEFYYIFDFPGQVEFFLVGDSLKKIFDFLIHKSFSIAVVNLFDLVHFTNVFSKASVYLIATLCVLLLEAPQVCVISKCDHNDKFNVDIEKAANVEFDYTDDKFLRQSYEFVTNSSVLNFEVLDIFNEDTIIYLQYIIDSCSGYIYYNEEGINEEYKDIKTKEKIIERYCKSNFN
ncbi:hypothetical protein H311_02004 [Anncaliia algerae PRA109]|nr:hypothetical protein H311_02004 [Anncaliia algerae PRA109]